MPNPTTMLPPEVLEAEARRLMAERASLAVTWQTRQRRRELDTEIEDALDDWLATAK